MSSQTQPIASRGNSIDDQAAVSPVNFLHPSLSPSSEELWKDMKVKELDKVDGWFWMVGSRDNINPLHHQKVLLRQIIPTDLARLHLVWFGRIIYIKPLPDCLLNKDYIDQYIRKSHPTPAHDEEHDPLPYLGPDKDLDRTTRGFLKTYCDLIVTPTDLKVAHELGLLNKNVHWPAWSKHRKDFLSKRLRTTQRYQFGELRMSRLNIVWRLTGRGLVYFTVHREYDTYFQQYFSLFIAAFAIVATILTAMQVLVGIATTPQSVEQVSYWFGITAMIIILACLAPVLILFVGMFLSNVGIALWRKICGKGGGEYEDLENGSGGSGGSVKSQ